MSVNGEDEARIAREGRHAESVAVVIWCAENVPTETSCHELTALLSEHSQQQAERRQNRHNSYPCH